MTNKAENRIAKLEAALLPFAKYGLYIQTNPFMRHRKGDTKICDLAYVPTVDDFKKAAELVETDTNFKLPNLEEL